MSKVPSLSYELVVRALRRDGWVVQQARLSVERFLDLV